MIDEGRRAGLWPVHDDRLISAALVSVYDELVLEGALRTGQGKNEYKD